MGDISKDTAGSSWDTLFLRDILGHSCWNHPNRIVKLINISNQVTNSINVPLMFDLDLVSK